MSILMESGLIVALMTPKELVKSVEDLRPNVFAVKLYLRAQDVNYRLFSMWSTSSSEFYVNCALRLTR